VQADTNAPVFTTGEQESWSGRLARLLRRPFTKTLPTAIDTGLACLKAEAEQRATP
jgi:hypothetical protein